MALWKPDPSFYPSAKMAMQAPPERHAYVAALNHGRNDKPDAICVVDLDVVSPTYGQLVYTLELPNVGDELHHFSWNACSSALCPQAPHPHLERRYLIVPGMRSSRLYIIDTRPDPRAPKITKVIEPEDVMARSGYSRPHTIHCGPDAIYISALGSANGDDGPGGIFLMDHFSFEVIGPWEIHRGDQQLAYDFWWHLAEDVLISSEWAKPGQFEDGLVPADLLGNQYGHRIHFWDLRRRKLLQSVDIGAQHQMLLELRPAHDPRKNYGFAGVVVSTEDLSASIWMWHQQDGDWRMRKVIEIPAVEADPDQLPPLLKDFGAVPPLVTDIDLSLDDRFLYVSCWGLGELHQYDVSDPLVPKLTGKVQIGGIINKTPHPQSAGPLLGGPQMVEISRDGKRVYFTNSLYSTWDDQFYPERMGGWMVKVDVHQDGGMALDPDFFIDFGETRVHQVRLEGGDSSTDSFCYPS
ncbi:selenium-binding protein SBP56-related protein [Biformimicrobium ophioploci]|uniref:Selenium-binding protein SBP56-related protein n=1 Tax=Biformimicrobium ophioploci TaxID=3036711 RepID=A0ABQ6LW76_9GAMM|nr:selenium-binding protein SBP56-related protein [Microbulbifer sp. NKW57]GMG86355.1 selenium-binding protein SBP56-related protein [Microbulbifer sp. NKW57]